MSDKDLQGYAVELANEALQDYEFIAVTENCEELTNDEWIQVHDLITKRVKVYIPTEPQIIRTFPELEALDPDTALTLYTWEEAGIWSASYFQKRFEDNGHIPDLPATVIATGAQVRAAREAMEQDNG